MKEIKRKTQGGAIEIIPDQERKTELADLKNAKKALKGKRAGELTNAEMKVLVYELALKAGLIDKN